MQSDTEKLQSFSILALIETVIASLISFYIAWKTNFVWQILISSLISPLFLLRSKKSTSYAIAGTEYVFDNWVDYESPDEGVFGLVKFVIGVATVIPAVLAVKFYKSLLFFARNPISSIKQIPKNFYYNVFVLDIRQTPQLVPGANEITEMNFARSNYNLYGLILEPLTDVVGLLKEEPRGFSAKSLLIFMWAVYLIAVVLPAIIVCFSFRYCIKSTSIVWLPLLWILYNANPGRDTNAKMRIAIQQPWFKVVMVYSVFVVIAFSIKVALFVGAVSVHLPEQIGPFRRIGEELLDPLKVPLWQVAGFTNAILALVFYNEAKKHSFAEGSAEAWAPEWIRTEYSLIQVFRTTLSLYTIACFLYILIATGSNREWPAVKFILFPW